MNFSDMRVKRSDNLSLIRKLDEHLLNDFLYRLDAAVPNNGLPITGEILEDKIFIPLYNEGNYGAGIAVELKDVNYDLRSGEYYGGEFFLYGAAFYNDKVAFAPMKHTCMRGSTYKGAILLCANIINILNNDEVASSLYLLIPQTVLGISEAEKKVGIVNSPLINIFYETLKNSLVVSLKKFEENNYFLSGGYTLSIGSLIKNLLNMNLTKEMITEVYELLNNNKLIPLLKSMKGNYELTRSDGMGNFIQKVDSIINYIKNSKKRNQQLIKPTIKNLDTVLSNPISVDPSELPSEVFDPTIDALSDNSDSGFIDVKPVDPSELPSEVFDPTIDNPSSSGFINNSKINLNEIKFCPNCGSRLEPGELICSTCGIRLLDYLKGRFY